MPVKSMQSAVRVLAAFEAIAEHQPVGVSELARILGDDKSALQRALATLADAGWIEPAGGRGTWQVTPRVLAVVQRRSGLRDRARAMIVSLRERTGETVALNVPENGQVVVLDVADSPHMVRTAAEVGRSIPVATAAAQAILAFLAPADLERYLGAAPDSGLLARLAEVRERGWAIHAGEVAAGVRAVGAPVRDAYGQVIASISVSGPVNRMPEDRIREYGELVLAAAGQV
jgi:IclR family transcriptional regulator, acetate operon repressor